MQWYHYVSAFFSGAFFINMIPHLTHGLSGNRFPTPFATPPGKGLSSPTVNTSWGLFNLLVFILLLKVSRVSVHDNALIALWFIGAVLLAFPLSKNFSSKMKE